MKYFLFVFCICLLSNCMSAEAMREQERWNKIQTELANDKAEESDCTPKCDKNNVCTVPTHCVSEWKTTPSVNHGENIKRWQNNYSKEERAKIERRFREMDMNDNERYILMQIESLESKKQ